MTTDAGFDETPDPAGFAAPPEPPSPAGPMSFMDRYRAERAKPTGPKRTAIGCITLLVIAVACRQCVGSLGTSGDRTTPTATIEVATAEASTDEPTDEVKAEPAVEDTAATESPTDEPTDEPTEDANVAAVCDYLKWTVDTITPVGPAISAMGERLTDAGETPALVLDADWRIGVAASLAVLNLAVEEIRGRDQSEVPDAALKLHVQLSQLATAMETVSTNLAEGIDEVDAAKIGAANVAMAEIGPLTTSMAAEIAAIDVDCSGQ